MSQQLPTRPAFRWQFGDTGPAVAEIRSKLVTLHLLPRYTASTSVFDQEMDRAVRHFQQSRGITADGVVGPETYRHLDEARWRFGDRVLGYSVSKPTVGDDVAQLQQRLLDMGFMPGKVDGVFGPATAHALRDFQRNYGLRPDSTCGPATLTALERLARTVTGGQPQVMRETEMLRSSGPALPGKAVVLDPGHGGADNGAVAHGLAEADVVWDITTRLDGRLAALGVRTYLTRGTDGGGDETDRAQFANATNADLMISLHVESHPNAQASGIATYYYGNDGRGRWSHTGRQFAGLAQRELVARCGLGDNRSHARTWSLLRTTRMPTVRIELGYLSNPQDAARLSSVHFRMRAVEAIAVAVQRLYLPPEDDAPTGVLRLPSSVL